MNEIIAAALSGRLCSPASGSGPQIGVTFHNDLCVPLTIFLLDGQGRRVTETKETILPTKSTSVDVDENARVIVVASNSGAFVTVITIKPGNKVYHITSEALLAPNHIGPIPKPSKETIVPPDSQRVLVGCGKAANGNIITREQCWQRSSESASLAPKEQQTVSVTLVTGRQESTTDTKDVQESLSTAINGGWGPISASLSASLSASSSHSQQITIENRETKFISQTIENKSEKAIVVFKWHLTDYITIFNTDATTPLTAVIAQQSPAITDGPYELDKLPEPPAPVRL